ncbi:hypothetical protein BDN72DRAFT_566766 [Pluteus cervinus]|uniref:Uncharacterized protein n=1 Tax=Pluteus cervinus TaxID=181527 RepID=A0ACD3AWR6_9AGAR|nr:hypothetical protein BDN72DRAFT_566766 [Pluteus cervinus]
MYKHSPQLLLRPDHDNMPPLPLDILGTTAEHLHNDTITLKAACLVAPLWRLAFQRILFSHVHIKDENSSNKFLAISNDHLPFRSFVRSLELEFRDDHMHGGVIFIIDNLPQLQSIVVREPRHIGLLPEFCSALRSALGSKHLTSLTLQDIDFFPLQVLSGAIALKSFSSIRTRYVGREEPLVDHGQIQEHAALRLHTLSLADMGSDEHKLLKWLIRPGCRFDLRWVRRFHFDAEADYALESQMFGSLLSMIPSTLEDLAYRPPPQSLDDTMPQDFLNAFNLTRFPNIRTLTLYTRLHRFYNFGEFELLPWCIGFLLTLPTPSKLESLAIQCRKSITLTHRAPFNFDTRVQERLDDLDGFLSSSTAFPNLMDVSFYLAVKEDFKASKDIIAGGLCRLERQDKLRFFESQDGPNHFFST